MFKVSLVEVTAEICSSEGHWWLPWQQPENLLVETNDEGSLRRPMGPNVYWEARGAVAGDVWCVVFSQTGAVVER